MLMLSEFCLESPLWCHLVELFSPTFPSIKLGLFGLMWRLLIYLGLNFEKIMYLFTFFYMDVYSLTITICGRWFFSSVLRIDLFSFFVKNQMSVVTQVFILIALVNKSVFVLILSCFSYYSSIVQFQLWNLGLF